jgi:cephalosporin hydroxylase
MKIIDDRIEKSQHVPEFEELLSVFTDLKPKYVLEIGSLMGWSLRHWIHYSQSESTVVSIDLPISQFCGPGDSRCIDQERAIKTEWPQWAKANKTKLYLIQSVSQSIKVKEQVEEILDGNKLDFIFIDGNHLYEYVKQDFEIYLPLVRTGGVIAFHDIARNEEGTVDELWNEIKNNFNHKEIMLHPNAEKGIGVIFK